METGAISTGMAAVRELLTAECIVLDHRYLEDRLESQAHETLYKIDQDLRRITQCVCTHLPCGRRFPFGARTILAHPRPHRVRAFDAEVASRAHLRSRLDLTPFFDARGIPCVWVKR